VPDTTDYVTASAPGATDTYELSDLASPPATIDAIQLALARKTDAATRALALQAVSAARSTMARTSTSPPASPRSRASCPSTRQRARPGRAQRSTPRAGPKVTV
jgi:hypothetical protein